MKFLLSTLLLIGFNYVSWAQTIQVKVFNEDQKAIPDVSIHNLHTGKHVHTNDKGMAQIAYHSFSDTLLLHHIAYREIKVSVQEIKDVEGGVVMKERVMEISTITIPKEVKSTHVLSEFDISINPVNNSQEILQQVPGLFIGQHAGGGKAEQIFLRGFDIDHGTDLSIMVDGLPVNMVSHAHGQGYADLHFLIPETVENISYGKGAYYAEKGNFTTAGYVEMNTLDILPEEKIKVEIGDFNTLRTVGLFDLFSKHDQSAYVAAEMYLTDGWFDSPQDFSRINLFTKYHLKDDDGGKFTLQASYFTSKWDASGQIPWRAVNDGTIGRFGAIDDTEGGKTSRVNLIANSQKYLNDNTYVLSKAFFSYYDFELFSNFTFYLRDPVNGDQIMQQESRNIVGAESAIYRNYQLGKGDFELSGGAGFRYDDVNNNGLFYTKNRKEHLDTIQLGNVDETNVYGFMNGEWNVGKWLINPGMRIDYFGFDYQDMLSVTYSSPSQSKVRVSPKLNFIHQTTENLQLYLKTGVGFHSNDTRVVVFDEATNTLPGAYGSDLGVMWKPVSKLFFNAALWGLYLQQEFVYVGDEGVVEPGGETMRSGIDLGVRLQLSKTLFFYNDATLTRARSINDSEGENYIPLAPLFTSTGGLTYKKTQGFSGSIKYRWMGDRPANEDNSIVAKGYFVTDLNVNYTLKKWTLGVVINNLFNTAWEETQFATESQLLGETAPVEEIHFTPGVPFYIKGQVEVRF